MRRLALLGALLLLLAGAAIVWIAPSSGHTPTEILRHAERRLEGHPRLESVVLPVIGALKSYWGNMSAQAQAQALQLPFLVPALPPNPAANQTAGAEVITSRTLVPTDLDHVIRVGPNRRIKRIADAARQARDGDTIEIDPGDYVADVAVWDRARLTIRGMGPQVRLIAAGAIAEGKAIWVIRRGEVLVEGIEFVGARAGDANGAGIRLEGGQLTVRRCLFYGNQAGILTGGGAQTTLTVENSEFAYNGHGDGQSHHLYAGGLGMLSVTGSYFHHANLGHLIKSRAARSRIAYNRLTDETGGRASYELEFPNGGVAEVVGNLVQQGSMTQNSVMVSFGAEGLKWPENVLRLVHNTLVNDHPDGGTFVHVRSPAVQVISRNNLHAGRGRWIVASGDLNAAGDVAVDWGHFVLPAREDYRLNDKGRLAFAGRDLAGVDDAVQPRWEYKHPLGLLAMRGPPVYPGAKQSGIP